MIYRELTTPIINIELNHQEENMVIDVEKSEEDKRKEGLINILNQSRLDIQVRIYRVTSYTWLCCSGTL